MSFPAPLAALHPKVDVIKITANKLNKTSFFMRTSFLLFFRYKLNCKFNNYYRNADYCQSNTNTCKNIQSFDNFLK